MFQIFTFQLSSWNNSERSDLKKTRNRTKMTRLYFQISGIWPQILAYDAKISKLLPLVTSLAEF